MGLIESVEACSDEVESHRDKDTHEAIRQDATSCTFLVLGGHIALDNSLVAGVGNEVVGYATTQDSHPEGDVPVVPTPDEEPHLVVVDSQLPGS